MCVHMCTCVCSVCMCMRVCNCVCVLCVHMHVCAVYAPLLRQRNRSCEWGLQYFTLYACVVVDLYLYETCTTSVSLKTIFTFTNLMFKVL